MNWIYKEKVISEISEMPEGTIGFIYRITHNITGQYYIGKKSLYSHRTLAPLKGYKRNRKVVKEMKWQDYCSSNDIVKTWTNEPITKEILRFCQSKKALTYYELQEQFANNVLADEKSLNENLMGKFFKRDLEIS